MGVNSPHVLQAENRAPDFAGMRTEDLRVNFIAEEILKGITLDARRGEILSIIGPAGAGKTTYLRCLNRMLELGRVSAEWTGQVRKDFRDAEADERTLMTTPLVIEVIADRQ